MNDNGGLSAADVALLAGNNNNDSFGNGGWGGMIWLFAILALMGGGFGGNWGNNRGGACSSCATQDFIQNGFNFNDLQSQNRDILNAISSGTAQTIAAASQTKYDNITAIKESQSELTAQIGDIRTNQMQLLANQNDCYIGNDSLAA